MIQKNLRIGVVGLGLIGSLHARIMAECPNAQLMAVADIDLEIARAVAQRLGCTAYTDFVSMCDQEDLDAVCICTPDEFHLENAEYAAKKGLHLLVEKPLAANAEQAEKIVKIAENAGVRLMAAHVLHFDPRYAQLRDAVRQGRLGDPIHMFFRRTNPRENGRRLGGRVSVFHFIGVHDFEMLCFCMQSRPVRVYAQRVSKINADIGCEDTVMSTVNFENGAVGVVELCWALPNNTALGINTYAEYVGTVGAGYVNIMDQGVSIITEDTVEYPDTLHWPEYNGQIQGNLKEELHHFVSATLKDAPYVTCLDSAVDAVRVIDACFQSIETGLPVEL